MDEALRGNVVQPFMIHYAFLEALVRFDNGQCEIMENLTSQRCG